VRLKKQLRGEHIIKRSTIKRQHEYYGGSLQDGHVANYTKKNSVYLIEDTDLVRYKDQSMNAFKLGNLYFFGKSYKIHAYFM